MANYDYMQIAELIMPFLGGVFAAGISALVYWAKFLSPKFASQIEAHVTHATEKVRQEFERDRERRGELTSTYKDLLGALFLMREEAIQIVRVAEAENHNQGMPGQIPSPDEENLAKFIHLCGWSIAVLPKDAANTVSEMATALQGVEQSLSDECIAEGRRYAHFVSYAKAREHILKDSYDRLAAQARTHLAVP